MSNEIKWLSNLRESLEGSQKDHIFWNTTYLPNKQKLEFLKDLKIIVKNL